MAADDEQLLDPTLPPEAPSPLRAPTPARATPTPNATPRGEGGDAAEGARPALPLAGWGRYELLGLLGRGGMGEVYEARDRRLGRAAALKFIRGADPDRIMRLLQEARAQARIEHPNVCKVYEVGEAEGRSYIAMQLVRGQRLDEAAAEMPLPAKVRAMREVAEAIHEAHRLGIVHRDLKPSNVLIERTDDGRWHPVVVDFGLAYEVDRAQSLTETGALLGTPAYMAPEQVLGRSAGIDQRSDVYGLGATLYQLLGGAAPFEAESTAGTLLKVLHEEPAPLRTRVPDLPAELETIALKCLSKEPDRRYPSARALADDLGRFLDGEPILGRRPGLVLRLRRVARKHRAFAVLALLSLLVTLSLGAFGARSWLEARRAQAGAAERARLAEQLGQQAKEIEWFLRSAYALPLHDAGREQQRVRERMARIAARRGENEDRGGERDGRADTDGAALTHYALGRGHLALGEFDAARAELERARALGFTSPELHYALGRALGELYRRALENARRSGGAAWVAERQRELEAEYLAPARAALEQSRGLELESPRYLEGLVALYRRDHDAAARAAELAAEEAPWTYESQKLAGDVAYARATEQLGRGDYDRARAGLEQAVAFYAQAAEVGRSDARVYEALAEAWQQRAEVDQRQGRPRQEALARALEAAGKAVTAAPTRASGHAQRARALQDQYKQIKFEAGAGDAPALLDQWQAAAARAVELDPRDVYAYDTLGYAHFLRGLEHARVGGDPNPAWAEAVTWLTRALELQPNYPWALNDLALVFRWRGNHRLEHGGDPLADYAEAERHLLGAARSDPNYLFAYRNLSELYADVAVYDLLHGVDPDAEVRKALAAGQRALELDANFYQSLNQMAYAELTRAEYLVARGDDPRPPLARALEHLGRSSAINPTADRTVLFRARAQRLLAAYAIEHGEAPEAPLAAGRAALAEAIRRDPGCVDCRVASAQLGLLEAKRARQQGAGVQAPLRRALTDARRAVALYPYAEAHLELARVCWHLALASPAGAAAALDEGLEQSDRALRLEPNLAHARAVRGGLLLERARRKPDASTRLAELEGARRELARAFELAPLLRREYAEPAREIERRLAAGEGAGSPP
ncbi:MAG: serine/threonine protein kinase [Polyangiaceae bacterium]|nr:serine/threonine protein kinase [Polyangiaceae bacterium]